MARTWSTAMRTASEISVIIGKVLPMYPEYCVTYLPVRSLLFINNQVI